MIEKRYQVFVSSTYRDLSTERHEIIQALLELDCIPSGMELFPAANEDQWTLIKKVIDDCDYYIVVIAGKYGSIGPEGISYTEMEYRHALSINKPIIAFIHKDTGKLTADKVEIDAEMRQKLDAFVALAKTKMVKFWETPADLGSVVSRSLIQLIKTTPAIGWVKATDLPDESAAQEILKLRKEIDLLQQERRERQADRPPGAERLAQGDDVVTIGLVITYSEVDSYRTKRTQSKSSVTWNELFAAAAPGLMSEGESKLVRKKLDDAIAARKYADTLKIDSLKGMDIKRIELSDESFDTFIVQMVALGIIEKSSKTRSVKDTGTYWELTSYGERLMYELRAIPKSLQQ